MILTSSNAIEYFTSFRASGFNSLLRFPLCPETS